MDCYMSISVRYDNEGRMPMGVVESTDEQILDMMRESDVAAGEPMVEVIRTSTNNIPDRPISTITYVINGNGPSVDQLVRLKQKLQDSTGLTVNRARTGAQGNLPSGAVVLPEKPKRQ